MKRIPAGAWKFPVHCFKASLLKADPLRDMLIVTRGAETSAEFPLPDREPTQTTRYNMSTCSMAFKQTQVREDG